MSYNEEYQRTLADLDYQEQLTQKLDQAARAYYQADKEILSNPEYDRLYSELEWLEKASGIVFAGSPTQKIGYDPVPGLEKDRHKDLALSLNKTKDPEALKAWLGDREAVLSWKLDGLTIVATYEGGRLMKAVTRGNGEIGEVVTHNAHHFQGLPQKIPYTGSLVVRGEAFIGYGRFEEINAAIPDAEGRYKNPRNLASGTVRQLDPKVAAARGVQFQAFELVSVEPVPADEGEFSSMLGCLGWLSLQGFAVVGHTLVRPDSLLSWVAEFENRVVGNDFPSDGLVLMLDDLAYAKTLGHTGKYPRYGMAFKWADETADTTLLRVEWNTSRTGLINPVAVFNPVSLEGTTVGRATAHNVSMVKKLRLASGSTIRVYKANMIIPTILENVNPAWDPEIPQACPVCGGKAEIRVSEDGVETLFCTNGECPAKKVKAFAHFARRDSMDIAGLSEATLEKLVNEGLVRSFADIYRLKDHEEEIAGLEGLGEKSAKTLLAAIEASRDTTLSRFLSGLGIPLVGKSAGKALEKTFDGSFEAFASACESGHAFEEIPDFGEKMCESLRAYMGERLPEIRELASFLRFPETGGQDEGALPLAGKTFVVTGSLGYLRNRSELQAEIERLGGKVSGSVSRSTSYLVNNDTSSTSGKNKKAKELGVPILAEEDLLKMMGRE